MNEHLVDQWNSAVSKDDIVYHLGDFGFQEIGHYRGLLNGHIHLIRGNHDKEKHIQAFGFASIQDYLILDVSGMKVLMVHRPPHRENWTVVPNIAKYDVCLYGHVHNNHDGEWLKENNCWYKNCSVEVMNYTPQPLLDVLAPVLFKG
mgnify:CR=1 FL=1